MFALIPATTLSGCVLAVIRAVVWTGGLGSLKPPLVTQITDGVDPEHSMKPECAGQWFCSPVNVVMSSLSHCLRFGVMGCLAASVLSHAPASAHSIDSSHLHEMTTRSAGFLRDCGVRTPASVSSINAGCPNEQQGLVVRGSTVKILQSVNRTLSGQKGLWYQVRVVHNPSAQAASADAQAGAIGWLRANKF